MWINVEKTVEKSKNITKMLQKNNKNETKDYGSLEKEIIQAFQGFW